MSDHGKVSLGTGAASPLPAEHSVPLFWPMAAAWHLGEQALSLVQRSADFATEAAVIDHPPQPAWATPNQVRLELATMRLREFTDSAAQGIPILVDAPFAGHSSTIADYAPGQSLVQVLMAAGAPRVLVTDWKSATPAMRYFDIDTYLAELNVAVDDLGGQVHKGVSSPISPPRKPAARCSARRPECRVARLHKQRATPQCAALQAFPSGWPRHAASALSPGLPIVHYGLRRASRIHPHAGASAGVKWVMTRPMGLCQGGWLSAMYAARFPGKVKSLVLAGSPIDTDAGDGPIKRLAHSLPLQTYRDMVAAGQGLMRGSLMLAGWKNMHPAEQYANKYATLYQNIEDRSQVARTEQFERWYENPVDLPGAYYLQAIEQLFKENRFAKGQFVGLGRALSLRDITIPTYLLGGEADDITTPEQVFAAADLIGTPKHQIVRKLVPGGHIGLFMGSGTLKAAWPGIAEWVLGHR